jgi:polygalacturonase
MKYLFILFLCLCPLNVLAGKDFNILSYGARPVAGYDNGRPIQAAIDAAFHSGGGRVVIPAGYFTSSPLVLKSGVELHLEDAAILLASANRQDYSDTRMAFISAMGEREVAITGKGIIDGQGRVLVENLLQLLTDGKLQDEQWKIKRPTEKNRPMIVSFRNCNDVKVTGVTIRDAAGWVQSYNDCNEVFIDSLNVISMAYWNNDGIDIVDSKNVKITNSFFNCADDGICLKSEQVDKLCENIFVENCIIRSSASGFKIGTGSVGGFKHVKVNKLTVYNTYRSAIAIECVDGGIIEDIDVRNVSVRNSGNAIFLRLGHRNNDERWSVVKNI